MHWAAALITAAAGVPAGHAASVLIGRLPGGPGAGQRGYRGWRRACSP